MPRSSSPEATEVEEVAKEVHPEAQRLGPGFYVCLILRFPHDVTVSPTYDFVILHVCTHL